MGARRKPRSSRPPISSDMRQHFRMVGGGWIPKRSMGELEARRLAARHADQHAYLCGRCGRWHVGHD